MFDVKEMGKRIRTLRGEKSQDKVAADLLISRGALSFYENGERKPDAEIIYRICKYFDVTSDYLLGLSTVDKYDANLQSVCDYTGLSKLNIQFLNKLVKLKYIHNEYRIRNEGSMKQEYHIEYIDIISKILECLNEERTILEEMARAILVNENVKDSFTHTLSKVIEENLYDIDANSYEVLSGYRYKSFCIQQILSKVDNVIQNVIHQLSPEEYLYYKENFFETGTGYSLEKGVDIHIENLKWLLKEASDNAQHNPKNE